MDNNDILKKLRIALSLQQEDIVKILKLGDFEISKGAIGDIFRNEDHPNYMLCGDQILRHFLNGLIIKNRGHLKEAKPNIQNEQLKDDKPTDKSTYFAQKKAAKEAKEKSTNAPKYIDNRGGLKKRW